MATDPLPNLPRKGWRELIAALPRKAGEGRVKVSGYRIVGITYSAPARMPVGQRAVIVLSRV
jgi:hypothetical protein